MGTRILAPFAIPPVLTLVAQAGVPDPGLLAWVERMGGWAVTAIIVWIIITQQQRTIQALVSELQAIKLAMNTLTEKCCGGRPREDEHGK